MLAHEPVRRPMMHANIRDYRVARAPSAEQRRPRGIHAVQGRLLRLARNAANVSRMSTSRAMAKIVLVEINGRVSGVAYVAGGKPKASFFDQSWPIIRMLVVDPASRGRGIGRLLAEECIRRARRGQAPLIALHTTPIMSVALPMYLRMDSNCSAPRRRSMAALRHLHMAL